MLSRRISEYLFSIFIRHSCPISRISHTEARKARKHVFSREKGWKREERVLTNLTNPFRKLIFWGRREEKPKKVLACHREKPIFAMSKPCCCRRRPTFLFFAKMSNHSKSIIMKRLMLLALLSGAAFSPLAVSACSPTSHEVVEVDQNGKTCKNLSSV